MAVVKYLSEAAPFDAGNGVTRRVLSYTEDMMVVQVAFETGGIGAAHTHPHVQATYVASGRFIYTVGGTEYTLGPGDSVVVAPNELHGTKCLEAGVLVDIFTPMRKDFV